MYQKSELKNSKLGRLCLPVPNIKIQKFFICILHFYPEKLWDILQYISVSLPKIYQLSLDQNLYLLESSLNVNFLLRTLSLYISLCLFFFFSFLLILSSLNLLILISFISNKIRETYGF